MKDRGSYLLILKLKRDRMINIGRLGKVSFRKGFYVYVGSAMINLTRRINRHKKIKKRPRWHIDNLRRFSEFYTCSAIYSSKRLESELAKNLSGIADWTIPKFGSSDCSCKTHLFGMEIAPLYFRDFHNLVKRFDKEVV